MEAHDGLSALELTRILQELFHIAVSAQTVRRVQQKLGWRWSSTKYCELVKHVNKLKRVQHRLNILYCIVLRVKSIFQFKLARTI